MSDTQPSTDETPDSTDWKAEAEKWKALSRKNEDAAKANAEKARRADVLEADYSRVTEELTTAKAASDDLTRANLRLSVGLEKGLPKALIERLKGDDEETLSADADALLQLLPTSTGGATNQPRPDPSQGARGPGKSSPADQFAAAMSSYFN